MSPSPSPFEGSPSFHRSHPDRALFRVEYPFGERPVCVISVGRYEVLDISERGMRLNTERHTPFVRGAKVRAVIHFQDFQETVEGTVLRGNEREAVFQLREGFSLECIRREERRLIRANRTKPPH